MRCGHHRGAPGLHDPRRNRRVSSARSGCRVPPESIRAKISASTLIPDEAEIEPDVDNSTYDGVCYNVVTIKKQLERSVGHFDEAWYAYACFSPMYRNHYGMTPDDVEAGHRRSSVRSRPTNC